MLELKIATTGATILSASNCFFHCFASRGAGARRRAGTVEKLEVKVLPARKAYVLVS